MTKLEVFQPNHCYLEEMVEIQLFVLCSFKMSLCWDELDVNFVVYINARGCETAEGWWRLVAEAASRCSWWRLVVKACGGGC